MTSVAAFSNLRRTLTDVLEDELYHVPSPNLITQHPQQSQIGSILMNNYSWNYNSNKNLNNSPMLTSSRLFKNHSALNSEELLTIPDQENIPLSKITSHDMYYDVPENLPQNFNNNHSHQHHKINIFNEFADPNLTTTNNELHFNQQSNQNIINNDQTVLSGFNSNSNCGPNEHTKLLKFNDDLTLDYFTNDDDSKFVIFPSSMSPVLIPEEIEDEELSEDEDEDLLNYSYLDDINPNQLLLNNTTNSLKGEDSYQLSSNSNNKILEPPLNFKSKKIDDHDTTVEVESDVDKMSLASSQEYSSDSSIIDEEEEEEDDDEEEFFTPTFLSRGGTHSSVSARKLSISKTKKQVPSSISNIANSSISKDTQHQCHLSNPMNGKPCLKQFSRPYDLIRHQETIHAERKKIFRCVVCNEQEGGLSKKTFSRGDALSRHVRVKHGLSGDDAINAIQYAKDHVEYFQ